MTDINTQQELLKLSQCLLDSIDNQDWDTYATLCDSTLTAFEPEAVGNLVTGMDFHDFYFKRERAGQAPQSTISSPHVRVMGETAVISYIRLVQLVDSEGRMSARAFEETRVWQRQNNTWKHVHFHRSAAGEKQL